jgi:hypothetical protein
MGNLLRFVLALLCTLLFPLSLLAQGADTMRIPIRDLERMGGFTTCGTEPIAWVRVVQGPNFRDEAVIRAHELEHVRQMREFPSCAEYWTWVRAHPVRQIDVERRAYCEGARASVLVMRSTWEDAVREAAFFLSEYFRLSYDLVLEEVRLHCRKPP